MSEPLRIVFSGTPDFAAHHLAKLLSSGHDIVAVYTKPDSPAGRGKKLTASPVKRLALEYNIPVHQPKSFKSDKAIQTLANLEADIMVVVAYSLLLPQEVLDIPKFGCINVHGSILPRWRGAAPVERSIWAGDSETGVTIMQMDSGLDTGDILRIERVSLESSETSSSLYNKLATVGPGALIECISDIANNKVIATKQDDTKSNYAKKLSKEEARVDWSDSAEYIERCVRAFNHPKPNSHFFAMDARIKICEAHVDSKSSTQAPGTILQADKNGIHISTGCGVLVMTRLQIPGKKAMSVQDIINSRSEWFKVGKKLL